MTDESILSALRAVAQAGGSFVFNLATPAGGASVLASAEEAAAIAVGHTQVCELAGLSTAEYAEWLRLGGFVQCNSSTSAGRRCCNFVSGPAVVDALEWRALNGTKPYCKVHGGL